MSRYRSTCIRISAIATTAIATSVFAGGEWLDLVNESSSRLVSGSYGGAPNLMTDGEEKDFAWGDVDNDGDIDLVVVRKQDFTSTGKRTNQLLMNEGIADGHAVDGVLVDKTDIYADMSDVPGDNGFLTATNDRDVALVDVDLDGWLDMVTAPTLSDNDAKHIKLPRIYMNLGEDGGGNWLGFEHQDARMENFSLGTSNPNSAPRFCSVSAGDLNGDGYPDLYFGDYDSGGGQLFDYNQRVLMNAGVSNPGFFTDETTTVLPTSEMRTAAFGAASITIDMNNDGINDVVKQTSLNAPTHIAINYNGGGLNGGSEGVMAAYDTVYGNAPYFVTAGDLNNDGLNDLVVTDDGTDRYMIAQSIAANGEVQFDGSGTAFGAESAFGGNSWIADLDGDGWKDVIITNVDVDIPNCNSDRTHIYRNLGGPGGLGSAVTLTEIGNVIPTSDLTGGHDVAVFDLNGDGTLDIILGRCTGTQVWMQQSPNGLQYSYPSGRPSILTPNQVTVVPVDLSVVGTGTLDSSSVQAYAQVNGGGFSAITTTDLGGGSFEFELPAVACASNVDYYVTGELQEGGSFADPAGAPTNFYSAVAATGSVLSVDEDFEVAATGWTVENDASLTSGAWEQVDPNGTLDDTTISAPSDDATDGGTMCFVTENGPIEGGSETANDVDGGPTHLISPTINLDGTDAIISYARWAYSSGDDMLVTEVSNDNGANWTVVDSIGWTNNGQQTEWDLTSFRVSDFVTPTSTVRVRFTASDSPNNSVTEAGIDDFQVEEFECNGGDFASAFNINVALGTLTSGDVASLDESDDDSLLIEGELNGTGNKYRTRTIIKLTSPHLTVSDLDVRVETGVNDDLTGLPFQKIHLWNWNAGTWRTLGTGLQDKPDTLYEFLDQPNPSRFVNPTTGEIRIRVFNVIAESKAPNGMENRIDLVEVEVQP